MRDLIAHFPQKKEPLPETTVRKIVSLEETITHLAERMARNLSLSFREFTDARSRADVVVGFLALLELVKQGAIDVTQGERFGDITIESMNAGVPRYDD
jgi:chromatin segregation and condensation protein Rec8/ScpA/Scc1 (kleisin family)